MSPSTPQFGPDGSLTGAEAAEAHNETAESHLTDLKKLLQSCKPSGAITSSLLKRRRDQRNDVTHLSAESDRNKILWEICPSTTQSLKVVAA